MVTNNNREEGWNILYHKKYKRTYSVCPVKKINPKNKYELAVIMRLYKAGNSQQNPFSFSLYMTSVERIRNVVNCAVIIVVMIVKKIIIAFENY